MSDGCGKRARPSRGSTVAAKMTAQQMRSALLAPDAIPASVLRKMSRSELCELIVAREALAGRLQPLGWNSNSCYIDSLLMALFHRRCRWLDRHVLHGTPTHVSYGGAHEELLSIVRHVRGDRMDGMHHVRTCGALRRLLAGRAFAQHNDLHDNEWLHAQQDPIDVVEILQEIYKLPNNVVFAEKTRSMTRARTVKRPFQSVYVSVHSLTRPGGLKWGQIFPRNTDADTGTESMFLDAPFLYVQLHRNKHDDGLVNFTDSARVKTRFAPPAVIATHKGRRTLQMVSIVIHQGMSGTSGHYTALLKQSTGEWVYYDDMDARYELAGLTLEHALAFKGGLALHNAVGFVYMAL